MANNITSGTNLIVSDDATIGNNLYVAGEAQITDLSSTTGSITNLTSQDCFATRLRTNDLNVNGNLTVLGVNVLDYVNMNSNEKISNINYDVTNNQTAITGNTYINNLSAGTGDFNVLRVNGTDVINNLTSAFTNYTDSKISALVNGASSSLDTLKEIGDLLQSDHSLSQTLVSSISGINSSINTLTNNQTTMQSSINSQTSINTTLTNNVNSINSSISTLDSKVFALQSANTSQATTNSNLNNSITSINSSITDINGKITNLQSANTAQSSVNSTFTSNINSINSSITTLTNSVNAFSPSITNLNSAIDKVEASMNQKLTNFEYSTNKTRITDLYVDNVEIKNHIMSVDKITNDFIIQPSSGYANSTFNIYSTDASGTTIKKVKVNKTDLYIDSLPVSNSITSLQTATTGITYTSGSDTTVIDNNVTLSTGKNLVLGSTNVMNSLSAISDTLTGISYNLGSDTTIIDNNLTVSSGYNLNVSNINVGSKLIDISNNLASVNNALAGVSYTPDITTIDNHVLIPNSNSLYLGTTSYNVKTNLDNCITNLTNVSYNSTSKATTIGTRNGASSNASAIISDNSGSTLKQISFVPNSVANNLNTIVQSNDSVIMGNSSTTNTNALVLTAWSDTKTGVRIAPTSTTLCAGSSFLNLDSVNGINATTNQMYISNGTRSIYFMPSSGQGTLNGINQQNDMAIVGIGDTSMNGTLSISTWSSNRNGMRINNAGTTLYGGNNSIWLDANGYLNLNGTVSINNGNFVFAPGNNVSYKNLLLQNQALVIANSTGLYAQTYYSNENWVFSNQIQNGTKFTFGVRTASPGNDASGNPIQGTDVSVLTLVGTGATLEGTLSIGAYTDLFTSSTNNTILRNRKNSGQILFHTYNSTGGAVTAMALSSTDCTINGNLTFTGTINGKSSSVLNYLDATSSIQGQLNSLNSCTTDISYNASADITTINGNLSVPNVFKTYTNTISNQFYDEVPLNASSLTTNIASFRITNPSRDVTINLSLSSGMVWYNTTTTTSSKLQYYITLTNIKFAIYKNGVLWRSNAPYSALGALNSLFVCTTEYAMKLSTLKFYIASVQIKFTPDEQTSSTFDDYSIRISDLTYTTSTYDVNNFTGNKTLYTAVNFASTFSSGPTPYLFANVVYNYDGTDPTLTQNCTFTTYPHDTYAYTSYTNNTIGTNKFSTSLTNEIQVSNMNANNARINSLSTNAIYLDNPIAVNTFVIPTNATQIGYTFYKQFVSPTQSSTSLAFVEYSLLTDVQSTSTIDLSTYGIYLINVKYNVTSSNTVNAAYGVGFLTAPGTVTNPTFTNGTYHLTRSSVVSMVGGYSTQESFSFIHTSSSALSTRYLYIMKFLRYNTSSSGTITADVTVTRIA